MGKCDFKDCDRTETMLFKCRYCNNSFCRVHRLPENHECTKLYLAKSPLARPQDEVIIDDVEIVSEITDDELDSIVERAKQIKKKPEREKRSRHSRKRKEEIYETYAYDPESQYYATDSNGNVFTAKPSQRIFKDRAFFSLIGDHISVGYQILDFLIGMLIIAVSWAVISKLIFGFTFWYFVPIMIGIVSISYFLHIYPQKLVASRYGIESRYVLSKIGLILTLISSISPVRFLSPGVLVIPEIHYVKPKNRGLISLASIATNLTLATTFLFLGIFLPVSHYDFTLLFLNSSVFASQLVFFGMLPFNISIGKRIHDWNKPLYYTLLILTISVLVTSFVFAFFVTP